MREAVDRYRSRIVGARTAAAFDPQYAAQFAFMQRLLDVVDMAMEDEGIPEQSRVRVVRTVVYGSPNEWDAHERMQHHEDDIKRAMRDIGPRAWLIGPDGDIIPRQEGNRP